MNLHPMPGDTDVAAATTVAEAYQTAMGKTGNVGREEIGGALMHLLFSQVVQKRLAM
jgi:hypothetical protein